MQKIVVLFVLLYSLGSWAQDGSLSKKHHVLSGRIIDADTHEYLNKAHVINLNSVIGSTSDDLGRFTIRVQIKDTLYFSYIGYQSFKIKVSKSLLEEKDLKIKLFSHATELEEVIVKPYELTGVLEVDSKNIAKNEFEHIHLNGLPQTFETGKPIPHKYNTPTDAIFHPVDFMYELFGKKPKQLRKLKKLRQEDALREILEEKANREVLMSYLEMDVTQINALLDYCHYSAYFINNATDLQVIEAVLECYENYKALRKGSVKRKTIN